MGSYTHTGAGAGSNEEDFRDLEIRLGELMLLDTKKEKKGSRSRLVGVPTDVNDSDGAGAPHTKGPLSHLRSLCASVQKSASLLEAYRVDLVDKTMSERALKMRVNELLGLVERLKEEHNRQLDEHEQERSAGVAGRGAAARKPRPSSVGGGRGGPRRRGGRRRGGGGGGGGG